MSAATSLGAVYLVSTILGATVGYGTQLAGLDLLGPAATTIATLNSVVGKEASKGLEASRAASGEDVYLLVHRMEAVAMEEVHPTIGDTSANITAHSSAYKELLWIQPSR